MDGMLGKGCQDTGEKQHGIVHGSQGVIQAPLFYPLRETSGVSRKEFSLSFNPL